MCAQLTSIEGGLTRLLSVTTMILSGTAQSKIKTLLVLYIACIRRQRMYTCNCLNTVYGVLRALIYQSTSYMGEGC